MRSSKNSSKISGTRPTPSLNPVLEQKTIDKVVHKKLSLSSL